MKFVVPLTETEHAQLTRLYQNATSHRVRQRAHAILLSAQGQTLNQLALTFAVDRDTLSEWLDRWQTRRWNGLADAPKSGRPAKIGAEVEATLLDLLEHPTPALRALVEAELQKKTLRRRGTR